MAAGAGARAAALDILRGVRRRQPFQQALAAAVRHLSAADARLAHEVAAGVLRHRPRLDARIAPFLPAWHRTPPDLRDLLRIGAYQLAYLDRVPPYAAVQATVEVAKRTLDRRAADLVNAVLRRLAADAPAGASGQEIPHPPWLVERWRVRFGDARTRALLEHNSRRPELVIQPARWATEALARAFAERGIPHRPAPCGRGLVLQPRRVRDLPGYGDGGFIVQDCAQVLLVEYAAIPRGTVVWDACAAPGGKTVLLALQGVSVIASDRTRSRLGMLHDTLRRVRLGVPSFLADAGRPPIALQSLEAVLLDAPCTATGTLRRHPDALGRLSARRLERLVRRQAALLDGVAATLKPGGLLVYLTCSLEPEENEQQVDAFLERHPDYRREGPDRYVFPPDRGTDGGFGARLRRYR